ncbi:MAG: SPOR domain-containing protein, partial [Parasphingorhabdus sp.]
RQTTNRDLGPLETLWHVRAALNVAALSCTAPQYARLVDDYNAFITNNKSHLRKANNAIIQKFRRDIGSGYKSAHDRHQTSLYNYWSFSPLRRPFCDQAVEVSQRAIVTPSTGLNDFAASALPQLEGPFTDFYAAYEQYEKDLEAWRVQYSGATPTGQN